MKKLTKEELNRLSHVNYRLLVLEKSLKQMCDGMREHLEGLDPSGVRWDKWDGVDIILWLEFETDPKRPAHNPDIFDGRMELLGIRAEIYAFWKPHITEGEKRWGLDDGLDHSDLGECEGHPLQHFRQCYLFHEIYDHADVGIRGMLHLQSLWIEIVPHRSGDFTI